MAYIGRQQDGFGVRSRFIYTATGGQTTFDTDDSSNALSYSDGAYVDVYLNGVLLDPSDYTATSLTSIVLDAGAAADDVLEVIVYDVFSVFSGTFTNGITASEATVTGDLTVDTNTLYVDSTNNRVGIGTTSPEEALHVYHPTANINAVIESGDANAYLAFKDNSTTGYAHVFLGASGNNMTFFSGGSSERMRIDSSGRLLIGKTTNAIGTAGHTLQGDGFFSATRSAAYTAGFNRLSDDGEIVQFFKDGTAVGSIGSRGSGTSFITLKTTSGAGAGLTGSDNRILPMDESALADNNTDLGMSSYRFKDLYLGGSAYFGSYSRIGEDLIDTDSLTLICDHTERIIFGQNNSGTLSETARIDENGNLLVGTTDLTQFNNSGASPDTGVVIAGTSYIDISRVSNPMLYLNRCNTDGQLVSFIQDGTEEGSISVSGSTVSYNGGHLSRWSQLTDGSKDTSILKGTVMTNLDQMAVWSHDAIQAQDAVYDEDGNVVTHAVEAKDAYTEDNEQLNCMTVSSVEGDTNVAGVFVNWDNDDDQFNDMNVAMTGDMVIRIASGTTVARGDLLMSAGDGTAKPQGDDIVRSKTIAKVTSTNISHTYDDGSYLVPCVLMAC